MTDTIRAQIAEQQQANEELRAAGATKVAKEYLEQVVRSYSAFTHEVAQGYLTARLSFDTNRMNCHCLVAISITWLRICIA
jgi:hypothetical protein